MTLEHIVRTPPVHKKPTPILFLHGAWHAAWCYNLWLDEFVGFGYETHAMSLPGHGNSRGKRPLPLYGIKDYVAALAQVIDEITPTPFVVGHSMGGYVLQHYLRDHQLPGAILLASLPNTGALPYYLREAKHRPLRFLAANLTLNLRLLVSTPELAGAAFLTPGSLVSPDKLASQLQNESSRAAIDAMFTANSRPGDVTTPLLLIAGEKDAVFQLEEEQRMAQAYNAELLVIKGQGHNLMMERDSLLVAAKIREWIEKTTARSQSK